MIAYQERLSCELDDVRELRLALRHASAQDRHWAEGLFKKRSPRRSREPRDKSAIGGA